MTETETTNTVTEETATPAWFIDEGVPGIGERPTWLNEKFKSAAELAKSYHELEKKFGTAPEDYDLSKSKFLDPDYVPFQELQNLAKEKRVPKEVIDKMVDSFDKYMDEFSIDYKEEIAKLGENVPERLKILDNWAKVNLSEAAYIAITNNLKTAEGIKAMEEVRSKMMSNNTTVPNGNDSAANNVETLASVTEELNNNLAKYKTDAKYRAQLQGRLEAASKNSSTGFIDKVGA